MIKSDITTALNGLRKYGFLVYTFNSKNPTSRGLKGLPDHLVIGKLYQYWIEVKLGKDKLSDEQKIFKEMIERFEIRNGVVKYRLITDKECLENVIGEIYGK